ncbi:uridine kinase [Nocardia arthritidis]|uniref:Uridine kinase n=1 Tax=Nocardia arthritidis TaxID=228602 RepID=A0A6G9YU11_9NOCA|nr:uridine kinase [Nocardia arthritidis]QIS16698.1 uridine kinase [Nocardia arthritidis]
MRSHPAVRHSVSSWQQPLPGSASSERNTLVTRVAERVLALPVTRPLVAVDGPTGAGKTSFGHELAERIAGTGRQVLRASLDDFKRPWRDRHLYDRESGEGYYRNAFDYDAVARLLLEPLGPGGSGDCALCGIDPLTQIDHSAVRTQAADDAVLIVDGVFALRPEINRYWNYRIWLAVNAETAFRRGVERDGADAADVHRDRYAVAEQVYVDEVDPARRADIVIDNSAFDRPSIVRG